MSNGYDNTNTGAIWPAKQRPTDKHPHFTGNADIKCPHCNTVSEFWVSGWKKGKGAAPKAPSLKFTVNPKMENREVAKEAIEEAKKIVKGETRGEGPDDDIPF